MPIERTDFLKALEITAPAVQNRPVLPILSSVALSACDGRLTARCTDLDVSIATTVPITIDNGDWSLCLPAAKLLELISVFNDGAIGIRVEDCSIIMRTDNGEYRLAGMDIEDFPSDSKVEDGAQFDFTEEQARTLIDAFSKVLFTASTDVETRTILCGLHVRCKGGVMTIRATNGYIAGICKIPADGEMDIVIPGKAGVHKMMRLLKNGGPAALCWKEAFLECEVGSTRFDCRLVDGTYPDLERIIPVFKTTVTCKTDALKSVVQRSLAMANDMDAVRCEVRSDCIGVSAQSNETQAAETLGAVVSGDSVVAHMNGRYLLETLKHIDSTDIEWFFADPTSAMVIQPANNENQRFVIMPMRGPKEG